MPGLLNQVVTTSMTTLRAEVCSIFLIEREEDKDVVIMRAGSGFARRVVDGARYDLGEGLTGHVALHRKSYNFRSREELENLEENGKRIWKGKHDRGQWESEKSEFRNGIVLPLLIRKRCLGVIKVENKLPADGGPFSEHDELYLKTIANVVALAIENAKLHKRADDVMSSITGALEGQLDMQRLLDKVVATSMETLRAEVCSIFLIERDGDKDIVVMRAGSGFAKRVVNRAKYDMGEGLTGHVALNRKNYNFRSRQQLEGLQENGKRIWRGKHDKGQWESEKSEFRNGVVLPLIIRDRCLGVIKVENKLPADGEPFSEDDELYLRTIANVVALAIENAKLHKRDDEVMSSIVGALEGQLDMQRLLDKVVATSMETLGAEVCSIFLIEREAEKETVVMRAGSGFAKRVVAKAKYDLGEGLTGHVAATMKSYNFRSRGELEGLEENGKRIWRGKHDRGQWESEKSEFRNGIVLPLAIRDRCLGVIKVENKLPADGEPFSEHDELYLKTIANVVALAIENARLHEKSEKQLKAIAGKAAHRIHNQATNYAHIELVLKHEIKSPAPDAAQLSAILRRLEDTTINLRRMTNEIKSYGKPLQLSRTPTDLNAIVRSQLEVASSQYPWCTFDSALDPSIPSMPLDRPHFAEAVQELLRNSAKAISKQPAGRGLIQIRTCLTEAAATEYRVPRVAHLIVSDNGPGFPPKIPLFEPFESTDPDSTGLGLATVKEVVEAHGGSIRAELPASGAVIHIELPIL
jgi:signal transduction protein with GAF and PtsI domain